MVGAQLKLLCGLEVYMRGFGALQEADIRGDNLADFVVEVGLHKGIEELRAAFDKDGLDFLAVEVGQELGQKICGIVGVDWDVAEVIFVGRERILGEGKDPSRLAAVEQMQVRRQAQMSIYDQAQGLAAAVVAVVELGIVDASGLGADQNRLFFAAPLVDEALGEGAADGRALARLGEQAVGGLGKF